MSTKTDIPQKLHQSTGNGSQRASNGTGKNAGKRSQHKKMQPNAAAGMRQQQLAHLYEFTRSFFTLFESKVKRINRRKYSPLQVTLGPELASHFETEALLLVFQQAEPLQGEALVAHGSPIFDSMLAYLDRKSAVALQQLPIRHGAGEELLQAVRPTNAGIVNLRTHQKMQAIFAFHWRITYRADDKREEIYTVLLNEAGEQLPQHRAHTENRDTENRDTENADADGAKQNGAEPEIEATTAAAFDLAALLADAEAPPPETDDDGQPLPPKLPPMTHLVRLAESARKYAVYHADVRCVSHEAEILPRLYKTLNRLSSYYQQQIEEVYEAHDPTGEKRQTLEHDLERKLAEEVENHRLRVQLQLVNYAILQMPVTVAEMTLSDGTREVEVTVERNRYNGHMQRPTCYACGEMATTIALDRHGHITCDACVRQCDGCQEILCADCGVVACPTCGKQNCDSCGQLCWACGERACVEHVSSCPTCGDAVCHACQSTCAACGIQQCSSHLRADHVYANQGEAVLVCADCAIRCPGCEQYSAQFGSCETSGQRFCQDCLVTCTSCGKRVGAGFYEHFAEQPYCFACLQECPSCHSWALTLQACPTCQQEFCAACEAHCAICERLHCPEHSHYFGTCDHTLCHAHISHCAICRDELCSLCNDSCAICELSYCEEHAQRCARCTQEYCASCVQENNLCHSCNSLVHDAEGEAVQVDGSGQSIDLQQEPCGAEPRVARLAIHYSWQRAVNNRYKIYWGQNTAGRTALIVTQHTNAAGRLPTEEVLMLRGREAASGATTAVDDGATDHVQWMNEFNDWLRRMRRRRRR